MFHGPAENVVLSKRNLEPGYESLSTKKGPREDSVSEEEHSIKLQRKVFDHEGVHDNAHLTTAPPNSEANTYQLAMSGRAYGTHPRLIV